MTAPSLFARFAGMPILAILLFMGYGSIIMGWSSGSSALVAGGSCSPGGIKDAQGVGEVRRYKAWLANWNAMDAQAQAKPARKLPSAVACSSSSRRRCFSSRCCKRRARLIPRCKQAAWVVSGLYLVFALVRFILRRVRKGRSAARGRGE